MTGMSSPEFFFTAKSFVVVKGVFVKGLAPYFAGLRGAGPGSGTNLPLAMSGSFGAGFCLAGGPMRLVQSSSSFFALFILAPLNPNEMQAKGLKEMHWSLFSSTSFLVLSNSVC